MNKGHIQESESPWEEQDWGEIHFPGAIHFPEYVPYSFFLLLLYSCVLYTFAMTIFCWKWPEQFNTYIKKIHQKATNPICKIANQGALYGYELGKTIMKSSLWIYTMVRIGYPIFGFNWVPSSVSSRPAASAATLSTPSCGPRLRSRIRPLG